MLNNTPHSLQSAVILRQSQIFMQWRRAYNLLLLLALSILQQGMSAVRWAQFVSSEKTVKMVQWQYLFCHGHSLQRIWG